MLLEVLSLIFSTIAIIVCIPALSKIALYHLYTPKLDIFFLPAFSYSETVQLEPQDSIKGKFISIRNNDKKELTIQIKKVINTEIYNNMSF